MGLFVNAYMYYKFSFRMTERTIKVGVLCIQGSFIEHISMLQRLADTRSDGITLSVVDVRRSSQVADLDGLIIPGGESTTLSVFLRNNNFEEALKLWMFDEKRRGVVWGTCAGLILLSDGLAGQKQGGQVNVSCMVTGRATCYLNMVKSHYSWSLLCNIYSMPL